jgi:late competence protein required for DNA uptake (superfamily II DNA/RNA helicase)
MLAYSLNKNVDGQKILVDIQQMIEKRMKETSEQLILVIDLKTINSETNDLMPKLENKPT